jgi:hypothetical protein
MNHAIARSAAILLVTGLLLAASALAQSGGGTSALLPSTALGTGSASYDLTWSTVDGGGTTFSTGGSYTLGGTAGQPDAGQLAGGSYTLAGGFWGGAALSHRLYLPLAMRQFP